MITEHIFEGKIAYPFLTKLNKYNKFALNFYPDSKEDRQAIKATGTQCGVKEDAEGELFYTFTSEENPKEKLPVFGPDGEPISVLVANGSRAKVRFTVEKFVSEKYGPKARTRLTGVVITDLIPYEKKEEQPASPGQPSEESGNRKSTGSPKMPF